MLCCIWKLIIGKLMDAMQLSIGMCVDAYSDRRGRHRAQAAAERGGERKMRGGRAEKISNAKGEFRADGCARAEVGGTATRCRYATTAAPEW